METNPGANAKTNDVSPEQSHAETRSCACLETLWELREPIVNVHTVRVSSTIYSKNAGATNLRFSQPGDH
jgi:hypothetical protein